MKRILLLILPIAMLLMLVSCSMPLRVQDASKDQEVVDKTKIFNILITRWGQRQYSGLLVINDNSKELRYVLLDPTGIKLLEATIDEKTENNNIPAEKSMGPLAGSRLHHFLNEVLQRVYLEEPEAVPCSRRGLLQFCSFSTSEGEWSKIVRVWPFVSWQAMKQRSGVVQSIFTYSQPWLGLHVELKELDFNK